MKTKEMKALTPDEREARLLEIRQDLFHLRVQQVHGRLEKPSRIRLLRREVARLLTVRREDQERTSGS